MYIPSREFVPNNPRGPVPNFIEELWKWTPPPTLYDKHRINISALATSGSSRFRPELLVPLAVPGAPTSSDHLRTQDFRSSRDHVHTLAVYSHMLQRTMLMSLPALSAYEKLEWGVVHFHSSQIKCILDSETNAEPFFTFLQGDQILLTGGNAPSQRAGLVTPYNCRSPEAP